MVTSDVNTRFSTGFDFTQLWKNLGKNAALNSIPDSTL